MTRLDSIIAENLARVRGRIAEAAARAGREPGDVQLVAVTKYAGLDEIVALVRAGCTLIGENRPQQLSERIEALRGQPIRWHMIGPVQRNKIRRVLPLVELIHSADSLRMIEALDRIAGELGLRASILIEVNVSGDRTKHGFSPTEVAAALDELVRMHHVQPKGFMCMASLEGGLDAARRDFAELRLLRDKLIQDGRVPPGMDLKELSMGMSDDFEVAIEEGATMIRVGSALFEGLE